MLDRSEGPYLSTSQSREPRDKKHLYNRLYQLNQTPSSLVNNKNSDELLQMIEEQKKNEMIESIVVNSKAYFFFMCSSNQIQYMTKLRCSEGDASVPGIDTRFNLCDLWVTDSCYKNTRIVNRATGKHPLFLGPLIFHFIKDKSTLSHFALEMMTVDSNISHLKKIGMDMDESIYNSVKAVIPEVKQLYCVRQLRKRDEKKLDWLFGKTKCSVSKRNRTKNEILKDIYGDQKGSYEELGLAESHDKPDFNAKLVSLKEKWESCCSGFYDWFLKHRKEKFENSIISSARDGSNVFGMFHQNDIESLHFIEKENQCFQKQSVVEAAQSLQGLIKRQENDKVRAIYGAGNYMLAVPYIKF